MNRMDREPNAPTSTVNPPPARFRFELLGVDSRTNSAKSAEPFSKPPVGRESRSSLGFALIAGVILPAVTAVVERMSGACAEIFFDPVPTPWHVALILLLSLANLAVFCVLVTRRIRAARWLAVANSAALGISAFYAVLFLPLAPLALVALLSVVLSGHAILALSPLLAFAATLRLRRAFRRELASSQRAQKMPRMVWGLALATLAFVALDARITLTRVGIQWAADADAALRARGVGMLRTFGDKETLRQACYARRGRSIDLLGFLFSVSHPISPEQARQVYYRVTGESFEHKVESAPWRLLNFGFDENQGRATVGQALPGLSLAESHLDGSVDPDAALGYLEWTMVFANVNPRAVEARAEIQLPVDAVVSRVTLWIDGEEREAAFGGSAQVREAYQRVVRARRDPLLVTASGRNRVLAQCFPVPADGQMKIRLGITTPLTASGDAFAMALPHFLERNFDPAKVQHSVWIEADSPLETSSATWRSERAPDGVYSLRASLSDELLEDPAQALRVKRLAGTGTAWTPDPANPEAFAIRQSLAPLAGPPIRRLVVVIDGSQAMNPFLDSIADALGQPPDGLTYEILWSSDEVLRLGANTSRLRELRGVGGADNVPALQLAYDAASGTARRAAAGATSQHHDTAILWIHGPQPVPLESPGRLQNNWRRRGGYPPLYTLSVKAGKNPLREALDELPQTRPLQRLGDLQEDLRRVLETLRHPSANVAALRERVENPRHIPRKWGEQTSTHLARLWASQQTQRLAATGKGEDRSEAVLLAVAHQIVTAVSGAVVLESQAQYEQANLTPVDRSSVPTIPEPETWALMLVAAALLGGQWLSRQWRSRQWNSERRRWKRV